MKIKRPISNQPIPEQAKKVFKGRIFEVFQWKQKMFDGSFSTFEKIKRTDSVNVIPITKQGKILLSEQKQPGTKAFVGTLGGRMDRKETPIQTASRELLEESGMKADYFILWDSRQFTDQIDWAVYTFIAKNCTQVKKPHTDAGEKIKLIEVSFEQFIDLTASENFRDHEISLMIFQATRSKNKLDKLKKLFDPALVY